MRGLSTFVHLVGFELRYYLRRISTWVYFGLFFLMAFVMVRAQGGAWKEFDLGSSRLLVNSPGRITELVAIFGFLAVPVTAALVGNAVFRDFEIGIHPLFFTSPVGKLPYLAGRYVGAVAVNFLILLAIPLASLVATSLPHLDAGRVGPFRAAAYLQPLVGIALPNLLFTGALFFALAALTRQMLPNYVGGVLLLVGYGLAKSLINDIDDPWIAGLLDPFGFAPLGHVRRYWTLVEQNTLMVPFGGILLYNRLLGGGGGGGVRGGTYARFRFSHGGEERPSSPAQAREAPAPPARLALPAVARRDTRGAHLRQYLAVAGRGIRGIVWDRYFPVLVGACVTFYAVSSHQLGSVYGTTTYPVTYKVLDELTGSSALFFLVIVTFYAGELVWKERELRVNQLHDAMPVPTWAVFLGKLTALAGVVVVLLAVALLSGVAIQAAKGYYRFELGLYMEELFGRQFVLYLLLCVLALAIQVGVDHKYMGHLLTILFYVGSPLLYAMGIEHHLFHYASGGDATYSDMNGYGASGWAWTWFHLYWGAFAALLVVVAHLFWVRGQETAGAWRVHLARVRATRPVLTAAGAAGLLLVSTGGFIFYNTNVLNEYRTTRQAEAGGARYEKRFKRFQGIPQPRVVGVKLDVELYPERRDVTVRGVYRLRNKTRVPIDSVHVDLPYNLEIRGFSFSRPATRVLGDSAMGYYVYRLARPLLPGDSLEFRFDVAAVTRGFTNGGGETGVVGNGTFLNNSMMPSIGYNADSELTDPDARERNGLAPRAPLPPPDDVRARMNNYVSRDADWIDFEATVGTSADQVAVAPGYLQREWTAGGRRYFHYRMDAPILNFYSFLSARYAVLRDRWRAPDGRDVAIEVYYHPAHRYNVQRMVRGVKRALAYYTAAFGPYQHRQVRILEFPRYADFAQSFANTIPFSESIGFIADVEKDDIDYPFFVTAHEVAHQWWGHQVVGGDVQGAAMLSETLAEYSALMVMEREYGRAQMQRFLRYELEGYLRGRAGEQRREVPLFLAEGQQYIHYNKGALAMYALGDYIGEERLDAALARYLRAVRFQEPPYTSSLELLRSLREATPDSLRPVLHDLFETVTLYQLRTRQATWTRLRDGRYQVEIDVDATKFRADSVGNETEVPMDDLVDVGVFAAGGDETGEAAPLYFRRHRITPATRRIRVVVDRRPARAGIDPYHKLIDRQIDDNVVGVKARGGPEPKAKAESRRAAPS